MSIGDAFDADAFDHAFDGFRRLYNVRPERVLCAPGVLSQYAVVYSRRSGDALTYDLRHQGIPLVSAILAPGTIVFEGHVDEERMGDW